LPWRRSPAGRSAAGAAAAAFQLLLPPLSAKCPAAGYTCNCLHNTYSRLLCACCPLLLSQDAATRGQAEQALLEFRRSGSVEACAAVLERQGCRGVQGVLSAATAAELREFVVQENARCQADVEAGRAEFDSRFGGVNCR
jgi:hypothetical protein